MASKKTKIDPEIVNEVLKPLVIALASWATQEIWSHISRKKQEQEKKKAESENHTTPPSKKAG